MKWWPVYIQYFDRLEEGSTTSKRIGKEALSLNFWLANDEARKGRNYSLRLDKKPRVKRSVKSSKAYPSM